MIRYVALGVVLALFGSAVLAQQDPIESRRALMKGSAGHFWGTLNRMQRGEEPYDQGKVDAAFAQMTEATQRLPNLFPESSKSGGPPNQYSASPKIWDNKADFEARLAQYAKDVADYRPKVKNLDDLKAAYPAINRNCTGCHEQYRVRNR